MQNYGHITEAEWRVLFGEVVQIRKMLYGFRRVVLGRDAPEHQRTPRRKPRRASHADHKHRNDDENRPTES